MKAIGDRRHRIFSVNQADVLPKILEKLIGLGSGDGGARHDAVAMTTASSAWASPRSMAT